MPSCPPSCPKVKRELKRRAAEKKKALEAGLDSADKDDEGKVPEDRISVEEPTPADFDSGEKLESESSSQGRISEGSRNQQRSLRDSGHNLSGRSSNNRNTGSRKIPDGNLGSEGSDFGGSDGESRGPGKDLDVKSRQSSGSRKSGKDFSKAGPSTSSANGEGNNSKTGKKRNDNAGSESDRSEGYDPGEYFSDQDFDPSKLNPCSSECSLKRLKEEMMRRKREAKQKAVDDYLLNKGMNYFEDLCTCSASCLAKELWNDPFVRKIFVSAALFAVGIKLCWEMDAWYIPTR